MDHGARDAHDDLDGELRRRLRSAMSAPVGPPQAWSRVERLGRHRRARRRAAVGGAAVAVASVAGVATFGGTRGRAVPEVGVAAPASTDPTATGGRPPACAGNESSVPASPAGGAPAGVTVTATAPVLATRSVPAEVNGSMVYDRRIVEVTASGDRTVYELPPDQPGSVGAPVAADGHVYYVAWDGDGPPSAIRRVPLAGGPPVDVIPRPDATSFAVSAAGRRLVRLVSSVQPPYDGAIVVTDLATGAETSVVAERPDGAALVAGQVVVSADGTDAFVTLATDDGLVDCTTGATLPYVPAPGEPGGGGSYAPVGQRLFTVRVDLDRGSLVDATTVADGMVQAVIVVDGREVVVVEEATDRRLDLYDATTGERLPYVAVGTTDAPADFHVGSLGYRLVRPAG